MTYLTWKENCAKPRSTNSCYKKSKKYSKGMKLTGMTSTGVRNEIMRALEKEIRPLSAKRNNNRHNIKNKTTRKNYKIIEKVVAEKVVTLEQKIKSCQVRKLSRDNIRPTTSVCKRNRRFKKDVIANKRKEKHKRYRSKKSKVLKKLNIMFLNKTQSVCPTVYYSKSKNHY